MKFYHFLCITAVFTIANTSFAGANPVEDAHQQVMQRHHGLETRADILYANLSEEHIRVTQQVRVRLANTLAKWQDIDSVTGEEFRPAFEDALRVAGSYGMDTQELRALYERIMRNIRKLDLVGDAATPNALTGNVDEEALAYARAKAMAEKKQIYKNIAMQYIGALIEPDAGAVAAKLRNVAGLVHTFQLIEQQQINAQIENVARKQAAVVDAVGMLPLVGDAVEILATVTGETLDGKQLSVVERGVNVLLLVTPDILEQAIKRSPAAQAAVENLQARLRQAPDLVQRLKNKGADPSKLDNIADEQLVRAAVKKQQANVLEKQALNESQFFANTQEGEAAISKWLMAEEVGQSKRDALVQAVENANGKNLLDDENFRKAYQGCRQDKRCLHALDTDNFIDARTQIKQAEDVAMQGVDNQIINTLNTQLKQGDLPKNLEKSLKQSWIKAGKPGSFEEFVDGANVSVFNATNTRANAQPTTDELKKAAAKLGKDRDVTYQLTLKNGTVVDVPAEDVANNYAQTLYKKLNPNAGEMPKDYLEKMDHVVLTRHDKDAYYFGDTHNTEVQKMIGGQVAQNKQRAEGVGDTIFYKAAEFMDKGDTKTAEGMVTYAEGMRQATKQYDNLIENRLRAYNLPEDMVPARLKASMNIMRKVGQPVAGTSRTFSPIEAEKALKALGTTPREAARELGDYYMLLDKIGPATVKGNQ